METKETVPEKPFENMVTIKLTAYDCHKLLEVFDNQLRICNIDNRNTIDVYEKIASQIHDKEFCVHGSEKHRRLEPEYFKQIEELNNKGIEEAKKIINDSAKEFKRNYWWKRFWRKSYNCQA